MQKLLAISVLLLLAGCANNGPVALSPQNHADATFRRLADEYVSGYLAWRPQTGTALGLHQYDGRITDLSRPSIEAELARVKSFDTRLAGLETNRLSPGALYDYCILRGAIQRELFGFEEMQIYSRNPMSYAGMFDVNIYIKRDFAPFENRVRSLTAILKEAPAIIAAAHTNLTDTLPAPQIETAIDQADGAADFLAKDLVDALKNLEDEALKADFNAANRFAIEALRGFSRWLKREKMPRADQSYSLGRDKFVKLLQCEMINETPERLLDLGMRELRRAQARFAELATEIDPAKPAPQVFKEIQEEHPTEKNLIPDTARDLEMIRQFTVDHDLLTLPSSVRAKVMETPQYLRSTSFASMDSPGVFETKATEAYYYVTPPEPDWPEAQKQEWLTAFNFYTTDIVSIHEAYPGHYIQNLWLKASPATRLEKMFTSYAFTEGWAHYAEQMMIEEGFAASLSLSPTREERIKTAKYRLAQVDEALLRLCRYCVSIRMHCQGMTVAEAATFFHDNCYYEEKTSRQEALRGAYDPEYLYYTLGKLEILKLRDDCRKQEGARFSLKKFHDELLSHGAPPIRLLRERFLKIPALWDQVL